MKKLQQIQHFLQQIKFYLSIYPSISIYAWAGGER